MLLVGEWNAQEWVAATCAAAVAGSFGEIARARAHVHPTRGLAVVVRLYSALPMVVVDFGLLIRALASRREGELRPAAASNAWAALVASYSPNAYVVTETELHRLVPFDKSEEPVGK